MTRLGVFSGVLLAGLAILWAAGRGGNDVNEGGADKVPSGNDPIFVEDAATLDQSLSRPAVVPGAKEVVLLVHGTGMTPQINWDHTLLQPLVQEGFQPYYVEIPTRLFQDTQLSAEYISHAIKKISKEHDTRVSVISWSAGGLTTQWTLTFFPETRAQVKRHIAIAPSYRGSWTMVPLFYFNLYSAAVVQQLPWSQFLIALKQFGGTRAHVPTTNIGSSTDQIVQPGFYGEGWTGYKDAWRLEGPLAQNIDLFKLCAGKRLLPRLYTHETLLWEAASHKIIFDALRNEETHVGRPDAVDQADCAASLAPHLDPADNKKRADILPELMKYAPTVPVAGWPEAAIRDYAK